MKENKNKILLYGGSFDPLHFGHRRIIEDLKDDIKTHDKFIILVHDHPLKSKRMFTKEFRLDLIKDYVDKYLSDVKDKIEIIYSNKSSLYEVLTDEIQIDNEKDELTYVMGIDILENIEKWSNIKDLFNLIKYVVIYNRGYESFQAYEKVGEFEKLLKDLNVECEVFLKDIKMNFYPSSTLVRKRIHEKLLDYPNTVTLEMMPAVATIGVISDRNSSKFLLIEHVNNTLAIPGGFISIKHKRPLTNLLNEIEEETGIKKEFFENYIEEIKLINTFFAEDDVNLPVVVITYHIIVNDMLFELLENGYYEKSEKMDTKESNGFIIRESEKIDNDIFRFPHQRAILMNIINESN